jgi:hypothetical protein
MKKYIVSFLMLTTFYISSLAYPISPRPLRKLILESEYIAIVHIVDLHEVKRKGEKDYFDNYYAELKVREVLQGELKVSTLNIGYSPYMICPEPPHFEKGVDALVFINKRSDKFYVHALSYGVKILKEDELTIYKQRIIEMQAILKLTDKDEQFVQTAEWLVTCAEHPPTRYEGVYELTPDSNFMSFYDEGEQPPFQFLLSNDQKRRLQTALFSTQRFTYEDLGLVDLIYASKPDEIYAFIYQHFCKLTEEDYWLASSFMKRMLHYKTSAQLEALAEEFDNKLYGDTDARKELATIIQEFASTIVKL